MYPSDDCSYRTMAHKVTVNGKRCGCSYTVTTKSDNVVWNGVTVAYTNKRKFISEINGDYVTGNTYYVVTEYYTKHVDTQEDGTELHYNTMTTSYECQYGINEFIVLSESTIYSYKDPVLTFGYY